jgi:hypothetical protein
MVRFHGCASLNMIGQRHDYICGFDMRARIYRWGGQGERICKENLHRSDYKWGTVGRWVSHWEGRTRVKVWCGGRGNLRLCSRELGLAFRFGIYFVLSLIGKRLMFRSVRKKCKFLKAKARSYSATGSVTCDG